MDWAVLYLRLFTGASMLFHNIGKIQNYNEIISSYPSPLYINPPAVFVIVTVAEALLAVLIIMGLWVRHVAGHPPDVRLGRIRSRRAGIRVARDLRIPDCFGRRTVRLRRGSDPVRPKKMTNRTIIYTPAISIFGEIL
jgi:hypothetical protein